MDTKEHLVIELKRGRASDKVVGQILRYMGFVKDEVAKSNQKVRGLIIGLEDDLSLRRAISQVQGVDFNRYKNRIQISPILNKYIFYSSVIIVDFAQRILQYDIKDFFL